MTSVPQHHTPSNLPSTLSVTEILELLPHRYPFLFVDRVVQLNPPQKLVALKNITFNEPFFQGHFPKRPVFPGVLILEALAQATGVLAFCSIQPLNQEELYYFAAIDHARFKRPVVPGDQLQLAVEFLKERRGIARFQGVASVEGEVVCEATMMCARREV